MTEQDLSEKDVRRLQAYRQEGTIRAYRKIGKWVNQAVGDRSGYGHGSLGALSKRLGDGFSPEMLQHCRRLARRWSGKDAVEADRAGISLNRAIALLALDGLAARYPERAGDLQALRRNLIRKIGAGKIDSDEMLATASRAKLKVLRGLKSGARRKRLFDGAKALDTLLAQAVKRLELDRALTPASSRPAVSRLVGQAKKLKTAIAALYTGAVE